MNINTLLAEIPYANPLAPQWQFPDWGNSPWCESQFSYTFPLVIPTAGLIAQQLQFGYDSEFHATDWRIYAVNQDSANIAIEARLVDAEGKRRNNAYIQGQQLTGYLARDWVVKPGGVQRIDIRNLSGGELAIWVVFNGRKRFQYQQCAPLPQGFAPVTYVPLWARYSVAPPGYKDEPYTFHYEMWNVTAPFDSRVEGVPIQMDTDAPFYARTVNVDALAVDGTTLWEARLVDAYGNRLGLNVNADTSNNPYALKDNMAGVGPVSTGGRTIYPELISPAGGVMALDLNLTVSAGTTTGRLYLHGVKRFKI